MAEASRYRRSTPRRRVAPVLAVISVVLCVALSAAGPSGATPIAPRADAEPVSAAAPLPGHAPRATPNVIFFLVDDLSSNQMRFMPHTRRLIFQRGATFTNFYDSVSLCCSSRASISNGQYAQNTHIYSNVWPGGFHGYDHDGLAEQSWPYLLHRAGDFTSLSENYLNGYVDDSAYPHRARPSTYVQPGWSDWAVPTEGEYRGDDYRINLNGHMQHLEAPAHFLSDFTTDRAVRLIHRHRSGGMFMELNDFGPHAPAPASPKELNDPHLRATATGLR